MFCLLRCPHFCITASSHTNSMCFTFIWGELFSLPLRSNQRGDAGLGDKAATGVDGVWGEQNETLAYVAHPISENQNPMNYL